MVRERFTEEHAYELQIKDGCGPAVIKICFNISGICASIPQEEIKHAVYDQAWGGSKPQAIYAYLGRFYEDIGYFENLNIAHAEDLIEKGYLLIILWTDNLPDDNPGPSDGHYSILKRVNNQAGYITLIDPSKGKRAYDEDGFVYTHIPTDKPVTFTHMRSYKMTVEDFLHRWYDTVDEAGNVAHHVAIAIHPKTPKLSYGTLIEEVR